MNYFIFFLFLKKYFYCLPPPLPPPPPPPLNWVEFSVVGGVRSQVHWWWQHLQLEPLFVQRQLERAIITDKSGPGCWYLYSLPIIGHHIHRRGEMPGRRLRYLRHGFDSNASRRNSLPAADVDFWLDWLQRIMQEMSTIKTVWMDIEGG